MSPYFLPDSGPPKCGGPLFIRGFRLGIRNLFKTIADLLRASSAKTSWATHLLIKSLFIMGRSPKRGNPIYNLSS